MEVATAGDDALARADDGADETGVGQVGAKELRSFRFAISQTIGHGVQAELSLNTST